MCEALGFFPRTSKKDKEKEEEEEEKRRRRKLSETNMHPGELQV
jgi:hypothetical protein